METSSNELALLVDQFHKRLNVLEDTMKLSRLLWDDQGRQELRTVNWSLMDLQKLNSQMWELLASWRNKIEVYQDDCLSLEGYNEELGAMLAKKLELNPSLPKDLDKNTEGREENKENVTAKKTVKKLEKRSLDQIEEDYFKKIPKHIKKHLTLMQLNSGISEINQLLEKKYSYLDCTKKSLNNADQKLRAKYRAEGIELQQELKAVTGSTSATFFNDADVTAYTKMLKTKKRTKEDIFLVLRHINKIKQVRKKSSVKYILK